MRQGRARLLIWAFALVLAGTNVVAAAERKELTKQPTASMQLSRSPKHLRSAGVNPKKVVVQEGKRNYAGPDCPGTRWNCTNARMVVQIATSGGVNESECSSSGKSASAQNPCVIVQEADGGNNLARCIQKSSHQKGAGQETQVCDITQTNTTGKNIALIRQEIAQRADTGKQEAGQQTYIEQSNGTGTNTVEGIQGVSQRAYADPSGTQTQNSHQSFTVDQRAETGANNQYLRQTLNQDARMKGQTEYQGDEHGAESSSQTQNALLEGFVHQESSGVSRGSNRQTGTQNMSAPPTTKQIQDPRIRCCAQQIGNENNQFNIDQQFVQVASNPTSQYAEDIGECFTAGTCTITQSAKQNDKKKTNFASGTGLVSASIVCKGHGEINKCVAGRGS